MHVASYDNFITKAREHGDRTSMNIIYSQQFSTVFIHNINDLWNNLNLLNWKRFFIMKNEKWKIKEMMPDVPYIWYNQRRSVSCPEFLIHIWYSIFNHFECEQRFKFQTFEHNNKNKYHQRCVKSWKEI